MIYFHWILFENFLYYVLYMNTISFSPQKKKEKKSDISQYLQLRSAFNALMIQLNVQHPKINIKTYN